MAGPILIVDDEAGIRKTLAGILLDEGFSVLEAESGERALELVRAQKPALVVLDVWLPGMDGLEVLGKIRGEAPETPVVMVSGHATIPTAIKATQMGAADFIEKPLDLHVTVHAIKRALSRSTAGAPSTLEVPQDGTRAGGGAEGEMRHGTELNRLAFRHPTLRGRSFQQRTLSQTAVLYGQGLHSGKKSGLILEPLPPNSGIHFASVVDATVVPAHVDFVESTGFATTVRLGQTQAGTIEHLMSALHAFGISNLLIKCNGEVPVMDGSSRDFCRLIKEVGCEEQAATWYEIEIRETLRVGNDTEFIQLDPADEFIIDYTLSYPEPVGKQRLSFTLNDVDTYVREIAPSRTFGFAKDIGYLQKQGLALGGRFDNFVLFGDSGPVNDKLRFPDEPVRHKILDAIGDLYLLGRRIRGKVTASMTGHSDNIALLKLVREKLAQATK